MQGDESLPITIRYSGKWVWSLALSAWLFLIFPLPGLVSGNWDGWNTFLCIAVVLLGLAAVFVAVRVAGRLDAERLCVRRGAGMPLRCFPLSAIQDLRMDEKGQLVFSAAGEKQAVVIDRLDPDDVRAVVALWEKHRSDRAGPAEADG